MTAGTRSSLLTALAWWFFITIIAINVSPDRGVSNALTLLAVTTAGLVGTIVVVWRGDTREGHPWGARRP